MAPPLKVCERCIDGTCHGCKQRQKGATWRTRHPERVLQKSKAWRARNRDKVLATIYRYNEKNKARLQEARRRHSGVKNPECADVLLALQNHCCAICGAQNPKALDHDHATGMTRGFLCHVHNTGLGMFADSPELLRRAASYLENPPAKQLEHVA